MLPISLSVATAFGELSHGMRSRAWFWGITLALLAIMAIVQVRSIRLESQAWDEGIHLAAGYSYLKTGDFRMNPEHPPLFKYLCAFPLLFLHPRLPTDDPSWNDPNLETAAARFGDVFLYQNRVPADTLLFWGRVPAMAVTLLFGLLLALWTRRRFSTPAALVALFFFTTDPNLIAHGRYIGNDVLIALVSFVAVAAWLRYLETHRRRDLILSGLTMGVAVLSKFSALFLAPALALLYLFRCWQRGWTWTDVKRLVAAGLAVAAIAAAVIAIGYGPATLDLFDAPQLAFYLGPNAHTSVRRAIETLRLPAHPFILGLYQVAVHTRGGHPAYLLGMHSRRGWWYYFPIVFAVKSTTAVLALTIVCLGAGTLWLARARMPLRRAPLEWIALIVPPALYLALSMRSGLDLGLRHILVVYPFLYILFGAVLFHTRLARWRNPCWVLLGLLVLTQCVESARIYPDYLAFFNILAGGPGQGPRYLADSNLDWGQDMKKLKAYLDRTGVHEPICLDYFGRADAHYYGIAWRDMPSPGENAGCLAAVSATLLVDTYQTGRSYAWLRQKQPIARIGYSIYVYDLRSPQQR